MAVDDGASDTQCSSKVHQKVERIREIDELNKEDCDVELLKEGILSLSEFYDRREKKEMASNYIIAEVDEITAAEKQQLYDSGIATTSELQEAISSTRGMTELATRSGIPHNRLQELEGFTDLMRVKGIGEEQARVLHRSGVKNRSQLAKTTPQQTRTKLKKSVKGRLPTEKQIKQWITKAKATNS